MLSYCGQQCRIHVLHTLLDSYTNPAPKCSDDFVPCRVTLKCHTVCTVHPSQLSTFNRTIHPSSHAIRLHLYNGNSSVILDICLVSLRESPSSRGKVRCPESSGLIYFPDASFQPIKSSPTIHRQRQLTERRLMTAAVNRPAATTHYSSCRERY